MVSNIADYSAILLAIVPAILSQVLPHAYVSVMKQCDQLPEACRESDCLFGQGKQTQGNTCNTCQICCQISQIKKFRFA